MKLDRNENGDGTGKYAIINLRNLNQTSGYISTFQRWHPAVEQALKTLQEAGALEWGRVGESDEFFLMKLKDVYSLEGLRGYADAAEDLGDVEWAAEVREMMKRAGVNSAFCKRPD